MDTKQGSVDAAVMVEPEIVEQIRKLRESGFGAKAIAKQLGVARNTVRRYLRLGRAAQTQVRPNARKVTESVRAQAVELYGGEADGNAAVVTEMLQARGLSIAKRTVQQIISPVRQKQRADALASVRFETRPGEQMQIDFGQRDVRIAGADVRVHFLAAVLSYSRRIFVKAFLSERQDDWREGIVGAFRRFGGVPDVILGDNARALVSGRDRQTGLVVFHPAYLQFCRDWNVKPKACWPYRARTKGKTESGVKYVKRNAIARREFGSFVELEQHLTAWMSKSDERVHGTTHETPIARFERSERKTLHKLPANPLPSREQRMQRRVANDAYVDIDTVRYSVPASLVRAHVEVQVKEREVLIRVGGELVATHARSFEPHAVITDPQHHAALWRRLPQAKESNSISVLNSYGRSLDDYAAIIQGATR